jgi:hypothetical protein
MIKIYNQTDTLKTYDKLQVYYTQLISINEICVKINFGYIEEKWDNSKMLVNILLK